MVGLLIAGLAQACTGGPLATRCTEGDYISNRDLFLQVADKQVIRPTGPGAVRGIKYESAEALLAKNPDCCRIVKPYGHVADGFKLPFEQPVELYLVFLGRVGSETPYYNLHAQFGSCPSEYESSVTPRSERDAAFIKAIKKRNF